MKCFCSIERLPYTLKRIRADQCLPAVGVVTRLTDLVGQVRVLFQKHKTASQLLNMIAYFKYHISSFFEACTAEECSFDKVVMIQQVRNI